MVVFMVCACLVKIESVKHLRNYAINSPHLADTNVLEK